METLQILKQNVATILSRAESELDEEEKALAEKRRSLIGLRTAIYGKTNGAAKIKRKPAREQGHARGGPRIDWNAVLAQMPKKFTRTQFESHPLVRSPGGAGIALARLVRDRLVRRLALGRYERR